MKPEMTVVENINTPGRTSRVQAQKYEIVREILLRVLPPESPGLTQKEMGDVVRPHLPAELWPGGEKCLWWVKTVQLDLEAKGLVRRVKSGGLTRWHRNPSDP